MSAVAGPFGLKPAWHPSGCIRQQQGTIASAYDTDIFQYTPVVFFTDGTIIEAQAATDAFMGVFMGVEWTASDGRRRVGNRWIANEVGTEIVAYFTIDREIIYEVQSDAAFPQAQVSETFDMVNIAAGSTTTGLSSAALDFATADAATGNLQVVGINPGADNVAGDAFTIVQCRIFDYAMV